MERLNVVPQPIYTWMFPPSFYALVLPRVHPIQTLTVLDARSLIQCLERLHTAGHLMHGDVKPNNMGVVPVRGMPHLERVMLFDLDTSVAFTGPHLRTEFCLSLSRCVHVRVCLFVCVCVFHSS